VVVNVLEADRIPSLKRHEIMAKFNMRPMTKIKKNFTTETS